MSSETYSLAEIASIQGGYAFKSSDFGDKGVVVVKIANIQPPNVALIGADRVQQEKLLGLERFKLRDGDILMAMTGATVGKVGRFKETEPAYLNQRVARVTAHKGKRFDDFIYALVSQPDFDSLIESASAGSAQANISAAGIGSVTIPRLSDDDQLLIGSVARVFDDRITLLRETNATLEAIAQALFKSWFVDFDPVRAKMEGRLPEGMGEVTAALFPDSFEETELGEMPRGWRSGCLADIAKTFKKQVTTSDLLEGIKYVGLEHIPRKSLSLTDWGDAAELESNKSAFAKGDILFGKLRPYFHKVVVAPIDGVCSTDILVCQPTQAEHHGVATMHLFSDELISYADRLSNGAKMPRVNWSDLAQFHITVPPVPVSKAYTEAIEPLLSRMRHNTHAVQTLATLRDSLLPRLISGKLRAP